MTRIASLFFFGLVLAAQNQTMIRVEETILLPAPALPSLILYQAGTAPVAVTIGEGLVIDQTRIPWVIKTLTPPGTTAAKPWIVDVMLVVLDNSTLPFTITKVPSLLTPVMVTKNGRVMAAKLDYLIDARSVTFLPGQIPQRGDVLQFRYQEQ